MLNRVRKKDTRMNRQIRKFVFPNSPDDMFGDGCFFCLLETSGFLIGSQDGTLEV